MRSERDRDVDGWAEGAVQHLAKHSSKVAYYIYAISRDENLKPVPQLEQKSCSSRVTQSYVRRLGDDPAVDARLAAETPLGRLGTPEDVASAIAW